MGTYEVVNGKLVYKQHNRTYRGKPTKHIKSMNEERKEVRRVLSVICLSFLAMTTQITNSFDIQAEGAVAENLAVEVAAPVDYSGIPYISKIEPTVEEQIRQIAEEKGFKWADYLVRLAKCESGLKPKNSNSKGNTPAGSVDRGLFQINNYWHKEVSDSCAYDLRCSTEWTIQRIEAGYQREWVCDRLIK